MAAEMGGGGRCQTCYRDSGQQENKQLQLCLFSPLSLSIHPSILFSHALHRGIMALCFTTDARLDFKKKKLDSYTKAISNSWAGTEHAHTQIFWYR